MEPLRPIDVRYPRDVDPVTPPVRLTPREREEQRQRREQARKQRRQASYAPQDPAVSEDGHIDLRA